MFGRVEPKQPLAVTVQHRLGGHHLGVQEGAPREEPQEIAAVAVGPLHHRGDTEAV